MLACVRPSRFAESTCKPWPGIGPQIDALSLRGKPLTAWVVEMEQRRRDADAIAVDDAKKIAQQAYQQDMNRLARDAATQTLIEAQDSIELGQPLVGTRNFQSGFMNRLAQVLGARDAISDCKHPFCVVKNLFRQQKVQYKGLAKTMLRLKYRPRSA